MASNIDIIVGATVDGALGGLRAVDSAINRLTPAAKAIGAVGKAAFLAISAAVGTATAALTYFVNEASKAQQVDALFDAVFDSAAASQFTEEVTTVTKTIEKYYNKLGQARYKVNYITETTTAVRGLDAAFKGTIISIADAASQVTRFDDEAITSAATELLGFGEIGQGVFAETLELSLDLAEVMKTDATSAAETLGRALSDIADGSLRTLEKQGLLTDAEREAAEAMAEAGDVAGAQAYVLGILDGKIGDVAETMGQTFGGQVEILKNNLGDLGDAIGAQILPVLAPMVKKFNELVTKYGPQLADLFGKKIAPFIEKSVQWLDDFVDILTGEHAFNVEDWLKDLDWETISQKIIDAINSVDWNAAGQVLGHWLGVVFETAKNLAAETDWSGLFTSIAQAIGDFATGLGGGTWDEFISVWSSNFEQLGILVNRAINDARAQFMVGAGILTSAATLVATRIITAFRAKLSQFKAVGKAILEGIKQGITNGWDAFASWLTGIVQSIVDAVLATLGIKSPSKVFADIGKQMMAGMAQGIARGAILPMQTMQLATAGVIGSTQNVHNNYYYGARLMLSQGQEGQILSTLTE